MHVVGKGQLALILLALFIGVVAGAPIGVATAVEVGAPAPGFKLPSTNGNDISLGDFKGKKFVLLEFYGLDFAPVRTANLSARRADYSQFEALGVQVLGISANATFSQRTFAQSLKLPFPLLSDFADMKVIRAYGIFNEKFRTAHRSFFLIDRQGVIRKKWIIEDGANTVVPSDTLLRGIEEVVGKR